MKHLISCLKSYRKEAALAPLFKLFEATLELIVPLVVAEIVDVGVASGDRAYILKMCLVLVGFGLVGLGFSLTAQYFAARAAVGAGCELRGRLFRKLQSFSFTQIDETGTSTMITRMTSDVNQVQTGVNMALRLFLRSPFIVFGAMAMAFYVDRTAALVFVAIIPLLAAVVFAVMAACIPLYQRVQEKLDGVFLSTRENLAGVRVIRAFRREERETEEFDGRNGELLAAQKRAGRTAALTNPLTFVLVNLAVIALVYVGALRVDAGALGQGDVIALYGYLSQILVELVKLANLIVTVTKAVSCQKRVGKVLDAEGEPSALIAADSESAGGASAISAAGESAGEREAVRFEHVTFRYAGGGAPALSDVDFTAKRGQTIGIIGGTGSGKSTLAHLIPRFYTATEGRVLVDGKDVGEIPVERLREHVGVVPQKAALFKGTIRSNLLWGNGAATEEELLAAVKTAQAEDVLAAKGGLDGEVAQEGKNLSGGQRQRLTIARALVRKPEILILDDSSSALDYATDARLRRALRETGCTVFLISQRTASVAHADTVLVLDDGRLVGKGTHEELLRTCEIYREIHQSQNGGERV
ncbi:MAG: ABC transporter ATP-binding protein [Candidatus Gallimonas sp.]